MVVPNNQIDKTYTLLYIIVRYEYKIDTMYEYMRTQKTIGTRKTNTGSLEKSNNLFELVIDLRGDKPFHPRGLFKFKTFKEKEEWSRKLMKR